MRKVLFIFVMLFISGLIFAGDILTGINIYFAPWSLKTGIVKDGDSTTFTDIGFSANMMNFNIFFDAEYVKFEIGYGMAIDGVTTFLKSVNAGTTVIDGSVNVDNATASMLEMELIGKYPFDIGMGNIWAGAGLGYSLLLAIDGDGNGVDDVANFPPRGILDDLYLILALGANLQIDPNVYLIPSFEFKYNLTPNMSTNTIPTGFKSTDVGTELKFGVGVGFKL